MTRKRIDTPSVLPCCDREWLPFAREFRRQLAAEEPAERTPRQLALFRPRFADDAPQDEHQAIPGKLFPD